MEGDPSAGSRFVQDVTGQGTEIFYQEAVSPRRKYPAAYFISGKFFTLQSHNIKARIHQPFCRCRCSKAGAYN